MPRIYQVSYDLHKGKEEYPELWAELEKTEHSHILESTWLVATDETPIGLFQRLAKHLAFNQDPQRTDKIFVSEVTPEWTGWLPGVSVTWLQGRDNLTPKSTPTLLEEFFNRPYEGRKWGP